MAHRDTHIGRSTHDSTARMLDTCPQNHTTLAHAVQAHHASVVASVGQQHSSVRRQYGGVADDRSAPIPNITATAPINPALGQPPHRPCTIATQLRSHATAQP